MKQQVHWSGDTSVQRVITVFNRAFSDYATRLVAGGEEPVYFPSGALPPDAPVLDGEETAGTARIIFTRDYFASALHEVAHWCVAGPERRKQVDYGYWYVPDGRDRRQQIEFEAMEVKPQALEWIFSVASRHRFRVSADNVDGDIGASDSFKRAVWRQAFDYCRAGLPSRAQKFVTALAREFSVPDPLSPHHYELDAI